MRIVVNEENRERVAEMARSLMEKGALVVYPTDTVYGLGTDARMKAYVERAFVAKGRSRSKPISVAVSSLDQAEELTKLNEGVREVLSKIMPGPYTVILRSSGRFPHLSHRGRIGLRMPGHPLSLELCRDYPITCTSANLSGKPSPRTASDVTVGADLVLDCGPTPLGRPSTVVELSEGRCRLLRLGSGDIAPLARAASHAGLGEIRPLAGGQGGTL